MGGCLLMVFTIFVYDYITGTGLAGTERAHIHSRDLEPRSLGLGTRGDKHGVR